MYMHVLLSAHATWSYIEADGDGKFPHIFIGPFAACLVGVSCTLGLNHL